MLARSINGLRIRPALALILLALFVLAGCGGGGVTGTYVYEANSPDSGPGTITLELKSGNKAVITIKGGPANEALPSVEGTWSQDGDKITTVLDGDTDVYTLKDGNLTIDAFGDNIVFMKK